MPPRLIVAQHLTHQERKPRYRSTNQPTVRSHDPMAWRVAEGHTVTEAAELLGSARQRSARVIHRYSTRDSEAFGEQRHHSHHSSAHPGTAIAAARVERTAALAGPAPAGDQWSSPAVSRRLEDRLERKLPVQRAYERAAQVGHPIWRV
jgi:hypothetical protein